MMIDGINKNYLLQGHGWGQDEGEAQAQFLGPEEGSIRVLFVAALLALMLSWTSREHELWWADKENCQGLGEESKGRGEREEGECAQEAYDESGCQNVISNPSPN